MANDVIPSGHTITIVAEVVDPLQVIDLWRQHFDTNTDAPVVCGCRITAMYMIDVREALDECQAKVDAVKKAINVDE